MIYYFLGHEQFQPEILVNHAQLAEKAGFDGVMVSEHFHPWVDDSSAAGFAWSTLGAIATQTSTLELMTAVTTPLYRYHPAIIAQAAATVDRLSNGRFALGVGTGENINEGPLGFQFPPYKERADRMREALKLMRSLLNGEKVSFSGEYYKTDSAKLYSPPIGNVPIYLAAGGPQSAKLAGELADGVITSVKNINDTRKKVIVPTQNASKGNKANVIAMRWSVYAQTDDEAWRALLPWRGLRAEGRLEAVDPKQLREKADSLPKEDILRQYSHVASVQDYIDVYRPLVSELKADIVGIQTTSVNQEYTIQMLGEEVLPELRKFKK